MFLHRRLQMVARVGELVFQRVDLFPVERMCAWRQVVRFCRRRRERRGRGDVGKRRHQRPRRVAVAIGQRDEDVTERARRVAQRLGNQRAAGAGAGNHHAGQADALLIAADAMQCAGNDGAQLVADHVEQVLRGPACLDAQQRLDAADRVHELAVLPDEEAWRHEAVEQAVVDAEQALIDGAARDRHGRGAWRRAGARQRQLQVARQPDVAALAVDLCVFVDGVELVDEAARAFTRAEARQSAPRYRAHRSPRRATPCARWRGSSC